MKHLSSLIVLLLSALPMLTLGQNKSMLATLSIESGRDTTSLNGPWHYIIDQQECGYYNYRMKPNEWGFFNNQKPQSKSDLVEYDFDKAPTMNIPTDWNTADPQLFLYEGTVWFYRAFNHHVTPGRRTLLCFGAVNYEAHVYVNGKKVGHHVGGFTPFTYDVTNQMKEGRNFVIVKADNKRDASAVPTQIFDWWNYGGITRDVALVNVPETFVSHYYLQLEKGDSRLLKFSANLEGEAAGKTVELRIPELKVRQKFTVGADNTVAAKVKARPVLWSPDSPRLYQVQIVCGQDTVRDEIGFRTLEARGHDILLNGKPIFLKGISIHEEKAGPDGGRATTREQARELLTWAKELGCNYVRLAHYPHREHAVREAEKMGIMVWDEIPAYWTIDWTNPDTYSNAQNQLWEVMNRDINRANVIIWSIANETPHSPERDKFLSSLAKYAKIVDSTRLVSMAMEVTSASNYVNRLQDNMNEYVDVVAFNQYVGWYRDVNDAAKMTWEIPYNKPIIISEMGGGAVAGLHGDKDERWTEEFQAELYRQNFIMLDKIEGLRGVSPWILKDFRSPRRQLTGVQDFFNRKGLVSNTGQKKMAFDVVREWYSKK